MNITLKNIKEFNGTDDIAFSCSVYVDGKFAFTASNGGYGGCNDYGHENKAMLEAVEAYAKSLPALESEFGPLPMDLDLLLSELLDDIREEKFLKRKTRTHTLFSTPTCKAGEYYTIARKFTPEVEAYILGKYPNATIVNKKFQKAS